MRLVGGIDMWVQDVICTDNDESFMCERCGILHPWRMLDNNYWIQGWLYACKRKGDNNE